MKARTSRRRSSTLALAVALALAIVPAPATAWSFSSLFGGDDDDSDSGSRSGSSTQTGTKQTKSQEVDGADLSDGTEVKLTQPLLKPTDWFITEEEIVESRGGIPRHGLQTYTTGNKVTVYTVANEFFTAVVKDFRATKEGDRVMYAGWDTCVIPFEADIDPKGTKTGFDVMFKGIVERGGSVNLLSWSNFLLTSQNTNARDVINSIPPSKINGAKAVYLFDDRVPLVASSQHQKTIVIAANKSTGKDEHPIAYVGGIDLTNDRWDTIYHNNTAIRKAANIPYRNNGWVDAHFRIHGPAAKEVANNFLQRWNSDYKPCQGLGDNLLDFDNPDYEKLPPIDYASSNTTSKLGHQNIQIVRTFSCKYRHYEEFAPRGEQSLFKARLKALRNAKNFIYIEDQYFIYVPELLDALMEVLPRIQRLIVLVQPPDTLLKASGYEKYLYEMIGPMKEKYPNKVQIYTTKPELDIYIHTKLVLIDDVYVSLGSANWNRRSMTSDSELNANVIDDETVESPDGVTVLKLARDMRIRKFVEMTRLSYKKLNAMKFIDAADQFKIAAKDESTILTDFSVKHHAYYITFVDVFREQVDPQEVCTFTEEGSKREIQ
ncbi:phospholipase D-like protein [Phytophthora sojae]|uniref:phospholipase D n=1 Tax=Phytophthora sojae (strain P6497) TaxID=1094619 RepID=G4Z2I1_PHYSP|nr:phospholipase D-like protein [Phytophthora sojae]EGZ20022.1 phospholipase D-like protein [Phytophthora sojae]|eukprot:XP_009522739.1 phospholipase D-like protein [Phytophthora sojae]